MMRRAVSVICLIFGFVCAVDSASAQIVALGASNTEGMGVGIGSAYPAQLEKLLRARGVNVGVRNAGVSGNTTKQMLARLDNAVPSGTRLVLFHPGGNDFLRGVNASERARNIAAINQRLSARGIRVIDVTGAFQAARPGNLQFDRIHLTTRGHERFAQGLVEQVATVMKK